MSVLVSSYSVKYYQSLGYDCKDGSRITVKTEELSHGSGIKIEVQCDYCGKIFKQAYRRYMEHPNDIACIDCRYKKVEKTNIKRFGCACSLRNEAVNKKVIETSMKRYGVPIPLMSKESIRKSTLTKIKRYGTPYPLQNPDILEKCRETMKLHYGKDLIPVSKNQDFLHNLYGGVLNYKINTRYVDVLLNDNICFEYDGGGHRLNVAMGRLTDIEFDEKEGKRETEIVASGYKIFRIISTRDKLPDDDRLFEIRDMAFRKLKTFDVYRYYIDDNSEKSYNV